MAVKMQKIKSGIIRLTKSDNTEYIFWTHADIVKPYIEKFLKQQFLNSLIIDENNDIDIVVIGENLPVEIQSTLININYGVPVSNFEKVIEKQIRDNVENYDRCWFFFDSEFFRYLQNPDLHRKVSINMDWFRKYMKEDKLKVFTVRYDGIINEVNYKDFDFLSNISMTCKIGYDNDIRVLNRNKLKILNKVLIGYKFSQKEIDQFRDDWKRSDFKGDFKKFLYKHENKRARLYARILHSVSGYLEAANSILDLNIEDIDMVHEKYYLSVLGIFDMENKSVNTMSKFIDKFNMCEYIPGYLRKIDTWNTLKGKYIRGSRLDSILRREYDVSKGIDFYWENM